MTADEVIQIMGDPDTIRVSHHKNDSDRVMLYPSSGFPSPGDYEIYFNPSDSLVTKIYNHDH